MPPILWSELSPQLREKVRRANPQEFRADGSLRPLAGAQRQHVQRRKTEDRPLAGGPARVGYRITILSLRRKLVDGHDNLRTGAKPLVDCIAAWLGFKSDDDPLLEWNYHQLAVRGSHGTVVKVDILDLPTGNRSGGRTRSTKRGSPGTTANGISPPPSAP